MGKKMKKGFNDGYISFSSEDAKAKINPEEVNAKAYELLYKAMTTSSKVQKKNKKGKEVVIDDIYPVTADETEEMSGYLYNAQKSVIDNNDSSLLSKISELRNIVNWSSQRHWTFQWMLIVGVVVTLFCISLMDSESDDQIADTQKELAIVEGWTEQDTAISMEQMGDVSDYKQRTYKSANAYKLYKLTNYKVKVNHNEKAVKEYRHSADTAKNKEYYTNIADDCQEDYDENFALYNELNAMKFEDVQKTAIAEVNKKLDSRNAHSRKLLCWTIFFMVLIPLYIISQRPYGYTITRLRLESKILGGIQKALFGLAGGMAMGAAAMSFAPDKVVKWSDGSTTRESDTGSDASVMAIKLIFWALAIIIFCTTSCVLMTYLTVQGLRRNYNWKPLLAKAKFAMVDKGSQNFNEISDGDQ